MMDGDFDLRTALSLLRRQLRLIFFVALLVPLIVAFALANMTPLFTATTLMLVDPTNATLLDPDTSATTGANLDSRIQGEVLLVGSDNTLLAVIESKNLVSDAAFTHVAPDLLTRLMLWLPASPPPQPTVPNTLRRLAGMVHVERQGNSQVVAISVAAPDPEQAAFLADAIAEAHIATQLAAKQRSAEGALAALATTVSSARQAVIDTEIALDAYAQINGAAPTALQLASLQDELQSLLAERQTIAAELATLQNQSTVEPRAQTLQAALQDLQNAEDNLRQQMAASVLDNQPSPETLATLYDLQQQAQTARRQYDLVLQRSRQLETEAGLQRADTRIVARALLPAEPSFPKPATMLPFAVLVGLALGVTLAVVRERLAGTLASAEQLARIANARLALSLPHERQVHPAALLLNDPQSAFSEAARRIRTNIDQHLMSPDVTPVIVVTSSTPGEGKTTTALALARAYALAGRRTLLIDADLRHPSIHSAMDSDAAGGLVDALAASDPLEALPQAMVEDSVPNLIAIAGPQHGDGATDQWLAGRNFERLLAAARESFDAVIIDTPALEAVVDGLHVAKSADVLVFLARSGLSSQHDVRKAMLSLYDVLPPTALMVPVLNGDDAPRAYRRYYRGAPSPTASAPGAAG